METKEKIIEMGFKEIQNSSLRSIDYDEIIEYYKKGEGWKLYAKKS